MWRWALYLMYTWAGGEAGRLDSVWSNLVLESGLCSRRDEASAASRLRLVKQSILEAVGMELPPASPPPWRRPPSFLLSQPPPAFTHEKLIYIPSEIRCHIAHESLNLNIMYGLPKNAESLNVVAVSLWIYTGQRNKMHYNNLFSLLYHIKAGPCHSENNFTLTISGTKSYTTEWVELDVMPLLTVFLEERLTCTSINIILHDQSNNVCSFHLEPESKPFLAIQHKKESKKRRKRGRDCNQGEKDCCRESLFVSFKDIGWDNWIVHPKGYDAYYCKGSCTSPQSLTLSASSHHAIVQKLRHRNVEINACCSPTSLSSREFIVVFPNGSASLTTIPNVVVETCGCM